VRCETEDLGLLESSSTYRLSLSCGEIAMVVEGQGALAGGAQKRGKSRKESQGEGAAVNSTWVGRGR
jgi:hypothetical protein